MQRRRAIPRKLELDAEVLVKLLVLQVLEAIKVHLIKSTQERLSKDPTGALANSWAVELTAKGAGQWEGVVGSERPYARIHNDGDNGGPQVIRPKKAGGWLSIPVGRTPRGTWPSDDSTPLVFLASKKKDTALLVTKASLKASQRKKGKGKWDVRYVLKRSVTIQPTFYVDAAIESATPEAEQVLLTLVEEALQAALGQ